MKVKQALPLLVTLVLGAALAAPGFGAQARTSSVTGTVGRVDPASRTLDVAGRGGTRTFTVPAEAIVRRQTTLSVSAVRVGDTIAVSGMPRQIEARSVDIGVEPASGLQARLTRPAPGVALPPPSGQTGSGAAAAGRSRLRASRVRVSGTVAATSPALLLRLPDGSDVQIALSAATVIHRTTPATLGDLKWGERVRVITDPATTIVREVLVGIVPPRRVSSARVRRIAPVKPLGRRPLLPAPAR
jgi:hypothetical protein